MSDRLVVDAGHNHYDPLRDHFAASAQSAEQDPQVVARCPEVIGVAANLCCRYADLDVQQPVADVLTTVATPEVEYAAGESVRGLSRIRTTFQRAAVGGLVLDPRHTQAVLEYRLRPSSEYRPLIVVLPTGIWVATNDGLKAGGHGELNYFRGVADKIREAAIPGLSPADREEQRRAAAARPRAASAPKVVTTSPL